MIGFTLSGFAFQFGNVPPLETYPFGWVVAKPFPQLGTRSHIFKPCIKAQSIFLHAAGPQPLDQETNTIVLAWQNRRRA